MGLGGTSLFYCPSRAFEERSLDYATKREARTASLFSRVTRADHGLIRAAAEAEGLSVSSYVAAAAVDRASAGVRLGKEPSPEAAEQPTDRHVGGA